MPPPTNGYASPAYAQALTDLGQPRALPRSGGWLLERSITGTPYRDAMGCYPLFSCADWARLQSDVDDLTGEVVSLVLVTDPFGRFDPKMLGSTFPDLVVPFKEHFIVDLHRPPASLGIAHHRRNVRHALRDLVVEDGVPPAEIGGDWTRLYGQLIARHAIQGVAAFSPASLLRQLNVPGLLAFRARRDTETVGIMLWYVQSEVAYYHLAAYSDAGYRYRASFGLVWRAIERFADQGVRWLALGAGSGADSSLEDGLTRFKRGWATGTRTAYLCGRVCDRERYAALAAARSEQTAWFPAYRGAQ
jgi:hypothetical protein